MANIKSQIKRIRQNERRRLRNKAVKSALKTAIRRFREAADAGRTDEAIALMRRACRSLDKAVSKGVIHRNQAANRKSAIARRAAALAHAPVAPAEEPKATRRGTARSRTSSATTRARSTGTQGSTTRPAAGTRRTTARRTTTTEGTAKAAE